MFSRLIRSSVALFAVGLIAAGHGPALKGSVTAPFTLTAGTPGWPHAPGFIADANGYFKDAGLSGITFKALPNGTQSGEAVGTGASDAGYTSSSVAINLISKGAPITIVAGSSIGGGGVVVMNKAITSVAQLRGKKVAVPQGLTVHEVEFRLHVLPAAGLQYTDISHVSINPPDEVIALARGDVDAAVLYEPFLGAAIAKGATMLVPPPKMWGGSAYTAVLIVRNKLIADNPALVQALVDAQTRAVDYINKNPDAASKTLATLAHEDEPQTRAGLNLTSPVSELRVPDLQALVGGMKDIGLIDSAPNLTASTDKSFVSRSPRSR
jgi:ABC-type nitrate/sulfonate/bicarbonate transport system substrate-binding protein